MAWVSTLTQLGGLLLWSLPLEVLQHQHPGPGFSLRMYPVGDLCRPRPPAVDCSCRAPWAVLYTYPTPVGFVGFLVSPVETMPDVSEFDLSRSCHARR